MLNWLIDNIYVVFGGQVFQQIIGIPMGTNCAPLLADLFLYSYEVYNYQLPSLLDLICRGKTIKNKYVYNIFHILHHKTKCEKAFTVATRCH